VKTILAAAAAILAVVVAVILITLPPLRLTLDPLVDGTVAGVMHVHTSRSDGLGTLDDVAAAAARAGLKFVIVTDHADATRQPDPPTYRDGVLCLDGVEISTSGGHYIAIDMPASPYPLGGEPRDVVEDVARLGGFGIAAHPDSPKPELRWEDWTVPVDGVELLNLDTSWRMLAAEPGWTPKERLLTAFFDYPFRPVEAITQLIEPNAVLPLWNAMVSRRHVVTVAGADAHAKLARSADPSSGLALPLPSYEASFRVLSVRVRPEAALSGNAQSDAGLILRAIRAGHLYVVIDGIASPPAFEFTASNGAGSVGQGDRLASAGPVTLHVRSNAPSTFVTYVHQGLRTISAAADAQDLTVHGSAEPGVYWAEILSAGPRRVTWIRSNPIYVGPPQSEISGPLKLPAGPATSVFDGRTTTGWTVEHDAHSLAAVDVPAGEKSELRFRFGLADGPAVGQYASLVLTPRRDDGASGAIRFRIRAEKPMRVSVQARISNADRWQRSVYVDPSPREIAVPFNDLRPVGSRGSATIPAADIVSVMFVVDTANTKTGTSGRIWLSDIALLRNAP
jgi:hypothetical protein